jgi:hypothetical protein
VLVSVCVEQVLCATTLCVLLDCHRTCSEQYAVEPIVIPDDPVDPNAALKEKITRKRRAPGQGRAPETEQPTKKKPGADDPAPGEDTGTTDGPPEPAQPPARIKNQTTVTVQVHCCS